MFLKKAKIIELAKEKLAENDLVLRRKIEHYDTSTYLLVDETHYAFLIKDGELQETLTAGKYKVTNKKNDTAKLEVVYVPKTTKMKMYWGTRNQFDFRDPIENILIKVGANGEIDFQIASPRKFVLELVGTKPNFTTDDLKEKVHGKLILELEKIIADIMKRNKLSYDRMEENKSEISRLVKMEISKIFEREFGLKVVSFVINGIIIPEEHIEKLLLAREQRKQKEFEQQKQILDEQKQKEQEIKKQEIKKQEIQIESEDEGEDEGEQEALLIGEDKE